MDSTKRRQTMSVLDQLRPKRPGSRYRNEWTGEPLPEDEEERQRMFEEQRAARVSQEQYNKLGDSVLGAATGKQGATGMSPAGMTPLSPEEFERRSSMGRVEKPEGKGKRKRKRDEESEETGTDEPVWVNAEY